MLIVAAVCEPHLQLFTKQSLPKLFQLIPILPTQLFLQPLVNLFLNFLLGFFLGEVAEVQLDLGVIE